MSRFVVVVLRAPTPFVPTTNPLRAGGRAGAEKVEVVNRLRKTHVLDTIRNYTVNYDTTWIFDKIQ